MCKQRERLVELLKEADQKVQEYILENDHMDWIPKAKELSEVRADYLLANGVIVPLCKVGDAVYALWEAPIPEKYVLYYAEVKEISIRKRNCRIAYSYKVEPLGIAGRIKEYLDEDFGKLIFLTKEEAEKALGGVQG